MRKRGLARLQVIAALTSVATELNAAQAELEYRRQLKLEEKGYAYACVRACIRVCVRVCVFVDVLRRSCADEWKLLCPEARCSRSSASNLLCGGTDMDRCRRRAGLHAASLDQQTCTMTA
eukprot:364169-Chlamydomonas_euryale.AAC.7